jgi:spermidine synthase
MAAHDPPRLDCVELHPTVVELAPIFAEVNGRVWERDGVSILTGDGRRYLERAGPSYDVIVGDLYLPINAGVGALFSREHFASAQRRLNHGGVFVAWLPLFQMGPEQVAIVARTFLEVFPDGEAWMGNWAQVKPVLGLVGRKPGGGASAPTAADVERVVLSQGVQEPGLDSQAQIQSRRLLDNARLRRWADDAPLNTFDHPVIEFSAPRALMDSWITGETVANANHRTIRRLLAGR